MPTAGTLIRDALEDLGIVSPVETPSADQGASTLRRLNRLVESWRLDPQWMYQQVRTVIPWPAFTPSQTIGPGAMINLPRPVFWIPGAGVIIDNSQPLTAQTELPIEVITDQRWREIPIKGLTSTLPLGVYVDFAFAPATGFANVYLYPTPSVGTTSLVLYTPGISVARFADYTTNYLLPDGYERALVTNLAVEIANGYGVSVSPELRAIATDSKALVDRANTRTPEARCDEVAAMGSGNEYGWNYRTGQYGTRV